MAVDSPVASRFVAAPDHWPRTTPIRAIVIHMAEGGGTVSWLTHNDGNSSHYVVEYSGRVTQMVAESRAAGSINPKLLRTSNDTVFTFLGQLIRYGVTAAKAALGQYWSNPNSAVIAIEVEGFAGANTSVAANKEGGPNAAQRDSLKRLVADIRRRRGALHVLGHRDFQSYKACPGKRIPWVDYGQHGAPVSAPAPAPTEEEMHVITVLPFGGRYTIPPGQKVTGYRVGVNGVLDKTVSKTWEPQPTPSSASYDATMITNTASGNPFIRATDGFFAGFYISASQVVEVPNQPPALPSTPPADCSVEVAAAVAATKASARVVFP